MSDLFKVSANPHTKSITTTSKIMLFVIIALLPSAGFGVYNFGLSALEILLISICSCIIFEAGTELILHRKVTILDFSAVVTGLLLGMNLPPNIPFWIPIVGSFFAIVVVKQLFGGLGQNFMNPALAARCFLVISFATYMTDFSCDAYTGATPLAALKAGEEVNLMSMIWGNTAGCIGETSLVAIAIGAIFLMFFGIIDAIIPLSYIASFGAFILLFTGRGFDYIYLAEQLAGGGLMLGAFFMATDYVTRPIYKRGQLVYGIVLGFLTAIFRTFSQGAEGVSFAIIIGNLLVPLFDKVFRRKPFGVRRTKA